MESQTARYRVWKRPSHGVMAAVDDDLALEEPLELRVAGRSVSITMRTPGHDEELAAGFLVGEGIVTRPEQIAHIRSCDRPEAAAADVLLTSDAVVDFARLTRHVFASSSCGVCGAATIEAVRRSCANVGPGPTVAARTLLSLPDRLRVAQSAFDRTGGLHAAGIFDAAGRLIVAREDIGRHNAVDKVIGHLFLAGKLPLREHILLVSGRASFEIVQKALAAAVPIVAAVSAPSSLAIDLATEANVTLVGFLRPAGFNIYSHPGRIGEDEAPVDGNS